MSPDEALWLHIKLNNNKIIIIMETRLDITNELLQKPIWQMLGKEFIALLQDYIQDSEIEHQPEHKKVLGMKALSAELGCCEATLYNIAKKGVLDVAVVSRIGRRVVYDVDLARKVADEYQKEKRKNK